jgi:hypothetical protein
VPGGEAQSPSPEGDEGLAITHPHKYYPNLKNFQNLKNFLKNFQNFFLKNFF